MFDGKKYMLIVHPEDSLSGFRLYCLYDLQENKLLCFVSPSEHSLFDSTQDHLNPGEITLPALLNYFMRSHGLEVNEQGTSSVSDVAVPGQAGT